jgi:hypothetical protein
MELYIVFKIKYKCITIIMNVRIDVSWDECIKIVKAVYDA